MKSRNATYLHPLYATGFESSGAREMPCSKCQLDKKTLSSSRQPSFTYTLCDNSTKQPPSKDNFSQLADNSTSFFKFESRPKVHSVFTRAQNRNIVVGVATRLWDGLSGFRIPAEVKVFSLLEHVLFNWYRFPPLVVKMPGREVNHHLHLLPRLRMCGAILLRPLYDFMARTGIS
jgi:hypothetical protein